MGAVRRSMSVLFAVVIVMSMSACGGEDGGEEGQPDTSDVAGASNEETTALSGSGDAGSGTYFGGALDDPYLAGEWCDSQGLTWVFEGSEATVGSGAGGNPTDRYFSEPGASFVSKDDDSFVIAQLGEEVEFTRGPCG